MGNKQSLEKNEAVKLLSEWSPSEKEYIKRFIEQKKFDNNHTKDLSSELVQSVQTFLDNQKDTTSLLKKVRNLTKYKDTDVIYELFQHTVKEKKVSLKTFVTWIVETSVPIWFETGSGFFFKREDSNQADKLVHYVLNQAIDKQTQQREAMSWLNESEDVSVSSNKWTDSYMTSPSRVESPEFSSWADGTPSFKYLLQIAVEAMFFGRQEASYSRRIDHLSSPKIQQHDKKTQKLFSGNFSNLLDAFEYFLLTLRLPLNSIAWSELEKSQRKTTEDLQHTLLFSSKRDGTSWQVFVNKIIGQGATLITVKDNKGNKFGGYADESWQYGNTDWYGDSKNFLFKLNETYGAWDGSSSSNQHFQYLCWGKKSLPNGLGMGGQFDYAGLWIDSDFIHGHSRAGPLCTTYSSPQLSSSDTFKVDEVEGKFIDEICISINDRYNCVF